MGDITKTVTLTWNNATKKGDEVRGLIAGRQDTLAKITFDPVFTDPTSIPDLGWQEDSLGNVFLANGQSSDIGFKNLGFFVDPSGLLTSQEIDDFIAGTLPLTPAAVPSGTVISGDTFFCRHVFAWSRPHCGIRY